LSSSESYTTIRAKTDCYVGLLPHQSFERLLERRPIVLLTLAKRLTSVLSPLGKYLPLYLDSSVTVSESHVCQQYIIWT
jgi:lysophospholipid hydrolase